MRHYDRRTICFAALLAGLAGYVDAMGFLGMGGFFVSFMSGNSTRLGVGLAQGAGAVALTAGGLIAAFLMGVVAGSLGGRRLPVRRRAQGVLLFVALLLLLAAAMPGRGVPTMALLAAAMGAENTIFERDREVSIGVTYMTGTLVRLGQGIAGALVGGPRLGWARPLMLWAGLVAGTIAGGTAFAALGLAGIWFAAAGALVLGLAAPDGLARSG
jgi:uncharacterized membrane protein YoaK (UPF0700 family)